RRRVRQEEHAGERRALPGEHGGDGRGAVDRQHVHARRSQTVLDDPLATVRDPDLLGGGGKVFPRGQLSVAAGDHPPPSPPPPPRPRGADPPPPPPAAPPPPPPRRG